jgi:hypothetical protein
MTPRYSLAQLEAALWAREGGRLHAIIDGSRVPGLPARLAEGHADFNCLRRGTLSPAEAARAAYIAELRPDSPLLRWLIDEATSAFTGWGLLMLSNRPLLAMRELARELAEVQLPNGQRRPWRWWDPVLLDALLPLLTPAQRDQVFAAQQTLVGLTPRAWLWWSQAQGLLNKEERCLL